MVLVLHGEREKEAKFATRCNPTEISYRVNQQENQRRRPLLLEKWRQEEVTDK